MVKPINTEKSPPAAALSSTVSPGIFLSMTWNRRNKYLTVVVRLCFDVSSFFFGENLPILPPYLTYFSHFLFLLINILQCGIIHHIIIYNIIININMTNNQKFPFASSKPHTASSPWPDPTHP